MTPHRMGIRTISTADLLTQTYATGDHSKLRSPQARTSEGPGCPLARWPPRRLRQPEECKRPHQDFSCSLNGFQLQDASRLHPHASFRRSDCSNCCRNGHQHRQRDVATGEQGEEVRGRACREKEEIRLHTETYSIRIYTYAHTQRQTYLSSLLPSRAPPFTPPMRTMPTVKSWPCFRVS